MKFKFDFCKPRHIALIISGVILLAGVVGLLINGGLNLDIQFEGGTHIEIAMKEDNFDATDIESYIMNEMGKHVVAQKQSVFGQEGVEGGGVTLLIKASQSEVLSDEQVNLVIESMKEKYGIIEDRNPSIQNVSPYIGAETLGKGLLAAFIAVVLILLYVWWRFSVMSGLSAALFATLGLVHCVMVVFVVYAVFRIPINDSFIAAILTILGYSINCTIIVYDRMRENTRKIRKVVHTEIVNNSLNQTLRRALNTTITTLISTGLVYVFALIYNLPSLTNFCLPLLIGLIASVYTTFYIVAPQWAGWHVWVQNREVHTAAK